MASVLNAEQFNLPAKHINPISAAYSLNLLNNEFNANCYEQDTPLVPDLLKPIK